jgi:hypothetical protein
MLLPVQHGIGSIVPFAAAITVTRLRSIGRTAQVTTEGWKEVLVETKYCCTARSMVIVP